MVTRFSSVTPARLIIYRVFTVIRIDARMQLLRNILCLHNFVQAIGSLDHKPR